MVRAGLGLALALPLSDRASAETSSKSYACRPSLSTFCRNIHVSCAGTTTIKTRRFVVSISGKTAVVRTEGTRHGKSGRAYDDNGILIELSASRDWIRIEPSGRYTHRIYRNSGAAMSYGFCR